MQRVNKDISGSVGMFLRDIDYFHLSGQKSNEISLKNILQEAFSLKLGSTKQS